MWAAQTTNNVTRPLNTVRRGTANLTGPDKLGYKHLSVNAGYDLEGDEENFPPLKLTCPNLIAFHIGIIAGPCGDRLCLCKNDWK